ncbi:calcium-dependent secretion activator 2-like [Hydractinia symbiolongicarpus]|uniref:calcium-dependent secretion activator 2-like n=1 Tax=Hydractinia symbiolongicarpus TaxID=13093 RepID=UPI0025510798|nr:calcium-dependent secretion activator 2-like [Hydractinia symbiolongicarpus]
MLEPSDSESELDIAKDAGRNEEDRNPENNNTFKNQRFFHDTPIPDISTQTEPILAETNEHLHHLQIYVFVSRCIAFSDHLLEEVPSTNKTNNMKITKDHIEKIQEHLTTYLANEEDLILGMVFRNAIKQFHDDFIACHLFKRHFTLGSFSYNDIRNVFHSILLKHLKKGGEEVNSREGLMMFDMICEKQRLISHIEQDRPTKEALYEMFQAVLSVKKHEHQILYNACQLDNQDEQLACVKRELKGRSLELNTEPSKEKKKDHFQIEVLDKMASKVQNYVERLRNKPLKGGTEGTGVDEKHVFSLKDLCEQLHTLKVTVLEVNGVRKLNKSFIFVVMALDHDENMLQTEYVEASTPEWDTQGEWTTACPYVTLKLQLLTKKKTFFNLTDEKLLAKTESM